MISSVPQVFFFWGIFLGQKHIAFVLVIIDGFSVAMHHTHIFYPYQENTDFSGGLYR